MTCDDSNTPNNGRASIGCRDVGLLYPAYCEGALDLEIARHVARHLECCTDCQEMVGGFRHFLAISSLTGPEEGSAKSDVLEDCPEEPRASWASQLSHWLDRVCPATVAAVTYRGGQREAQAAWAKRARERFAIPFLSARDEQMRVIAHRARGEMFGRIDDSEGHPLFPALVRLTGTKRDEAVLNALDGTFRIRWEPDALGIECQTALGEKSRFMIKGRQSDTRNRN